MTEVSLDIQELNLDDVTNNSTKKEINLNLNDDLKEANFGSGIELLMNDKVKNSSGTKKTDINSLESEINNIENSDLKEIKEESKEKDSFKSKPSINIAKSTANIGKTSDTWDGFQEINDINLDDLEKKTKKMNKEELLKEKFEILRKLEGLESKGATLSKKYNMESDLNEMKGEYEFLINEKEKQNAIKFQGKVLTTMITGLEFLNSKFDPFDIKLDGWSEQINENVEDFDEIFAELHEKYKSKAKMAPEIKLLFQLASSGIMIHMTNTMFKSALPGMDDIMRQNPDLMNHFTKAAVNSMENSTPGLSNFMNDFGMSHGNDTNEIRSRAQSVPRSEPQSSSNPKMRNDMKGPGNIDSLLSSLGKSNSSTTNINVDESSTISVEDLDNLQNKKKSNKRKSDKNTVSLAI